MIYSTKSVKIGWTGKNEHFKYISSNILTTTSPNLTIIGISNGYSSTSALFTPSNNLEPSIPLDIYLNFARISRNVTIIDSPCGNVDIICSRFFSNETLNQQFIKGAVTSNVAFSVDSGTCIDIDLNPNFCCVISNVASSPSISNLSVLNTNNLCILSDNTTITFTYVSKTFQVRVYDEVDNCCSGPGCPSNNSHSQFGAISGDGSNSNPYIVNCGSSITIKACASQCCEFDISGSESSFTINHLNNGNDEQGDTDDIPEINVSGFTQSASQVNITINNISDNLDIKFNYVIREFSVNITAGANGSFIITGASIDGDTLYDNCNDAPKPNPNPTSATAIGICGDTLSVECVPDPCYVLDTATANGGGLEAIPSSTNQLEYKVNVTANAERSSIKHPLCSSL